MGASIATGLFPRALQRQGGWIRASLVLAGALVASTAYAADFTPFVIRGAPVVQTNNVYVAGATEFVISVGGQKAGLGSSAIDGKKLGGITNLSIDRLDDHTRFTAGTGPYVAPYINIWITDGLGHYAVVANEPSDGAWNGLYTDGYHLGWADLANKVAKVYENGDLSWLPTSGSSGLPAQPGRQNPASANMYTFADLAGFTIQAPSVAELTAGWAGLGTGAPRELGTNVARGVNWIFGDTLSNYVSGAEGYVVANAAVAGPAPDKDGDGIPDAVDPCPEIHSGAAAAVQSLLASVTALELKKKEDDKLTKRLGDVLKKVNECKALDAYKKLNEFMKDVQSKGVAKQLTPSEVADLLAQAAAIQAMIVLT